MNLPQAPGSYDQVYLFRFPYIYAMLLLVIFLCLCLCFVKITTKLFGKRRRRRIFSCQRRAGKRCPWHKRAKIRRHIQLLQISRWIVLLLLLSFGASFASMNFTHDVASILRTQSAVSRFFAVCSWTMRQNSSWSISRLVRNKMMHILNENAVKGSQGKGYGKGKKAAQIDVIDEEEAFKQEIRNALPEAAVLRMMPQLFPDDWSVPVRNPFDMGPSEGVSLVQRSQISMVLKKVGYTHNKVAILTTQNASQLHLRGYPCQELSVRVRVLPDDGSEPKEVYIRRFLIQLGCGPHVEPKSTGENTRDDGEAGGQIAALLRVDTRSHSRQHLDEPSFTTCEPTCYRITPNSQRSFGHIFCSPICCARSLKS